MSPIPTKSPFAKPLRVVVVGASSGGTEALSSLVAGFPEDLNACVLIVRHLAPEATAGYLVHQLKKHTVLECHEAKDGDRLEVGNIYIAPSDRHLLVDEEKIWVIRGARENRWRPSIDKLFRSAAVAYRNCTIGVILSGYLDDGVAGLSAIKRCGGLCVVQDPADALFPDMPKNALANVAVDYVLPVAEIGPLIGALVLDDPAPAPMVPREIITEARIAKRAVSDTTTVDAIGNRSEVTCPDCGGVLWRVGADGFPRFRCHTGHSFTLAGLLAGKADEMEETLWKALRMFEERRNLLKTMANTMGKMASRSLDERIEQDQVHIERLRTLLDAVANPGDV